MALSFVYLAFVSLLMSAPVEPDPPPPLEN
jgi:hypothetical protein